MASLGYASDQRATECFLNAVCADPHEFVISKVGTGPSGTAGLQLIEME